MSLFNVKGFEDLADCLRSEALEGLDENKIHRFHHALTAQLFNLTQLPTELLLEYDQNIVKHTQQLNERRLTHHQEPIVWKYFQYLALLFTEIYLGFLARIIPAPKAAEDISIHSAARELDPRGIAPSPGRNSVLAKNACHQTILCYSSQASGARVLAFAGCPICQDSCRLRAQKKLGDTT